MRFALWRHTHTYRYHEKPSSKHTRPHPGREWRLRAARRWSMGDADGRGGSESETLYFTHADEMDVNTTPRGPRRARTRIR